MLVWGFGNAAHETSRELQKFTQASKFWGPLRQSLLAVGCSADSLLQDILNRFLDTDARVGCVAVDV